jgi:toxin-antitoxin system PIN domain toxin
MAFLLDVNVLIALIDAAHIHHETAHAWFERRGQGAWATCPITENGALRIVGHPRYPDGPGSPAAVVPSMESLRALPGYQFWPDDASLLDDEAIDVTRLLAVSQVTDTYLLALARKRGGQLATFDRRLVTAAVRGGSKCLHVIDSKA